MRYAHEVYAHEVHAREVNYNRVWEPTNWPQLGTKPGPSLAAQAPLKF